MTNYFNNLWTGALLHPARWRYTSERFEVSCGILLTLASFLFFFFKFAGICAVVTLIMWIFAVITPDRRYIISADGKRFFIALFRTGKKNARQRTDKSSRTALMRLSKFFNQQTKATECNVQKIFGYDDAYKSSGMFLFKTKPDEQATETYCANTAPQKG